MECISVTAQKGGTGKTTVAYNLGYGLYMRGKRVLLIDTDPQCNLTLASGISYKGAKGTLADVVKGKAGIDEVMMEIKPGLHILPGSLELSQAEKMVKSFYVIRDAIRAMETETDYIIMDCAPSLGVMTQNAITAADKVIIPMKPTLYGLQGVSQQCAYINQQKDKTNRKLKIDGILLTQGNERSTVVRTMVEQFETMAQKVGTKVYKARIRQAMAVQKAEMMRKSLFEAFPKEAVTKDFADFIEEFTKGE